MREREKERERKREREKKDIFSKRKQRKGPLVSHRGRERVREMIKK